MAEVRLVDWRMLIIKTARTTVTLKYEGDLIHVNLYDIELREEFSFTTYDHSASRDKLEALINRGVGADADYLRLLQEIRRSETQADYFRILAEGRLKLKELQKAVKLSTSKKFSRKVVNEYGRAVVRLLRPVLVMGDGWRRKHVGYRKTPEYHVFLIYARSTLDEQSIDPIVAIFVGGFGVKALKIINRCYIEYAVYKYLVESDTSLLEKWMSKAPGANLNEIIDLLRQGEENGTLHVIDEELYAFLKSAISLQILVC
jgi:hypothetical protein